MNITPCRNHANQAYRNQQAFHDADNAHGVRLMCARYGAAMLLATVLLYAVGCEQKRIAPPAPPPPVVSVTRPVTATVQSYHEYNGNLEAMETVQVQARVKGFLKEIAFTEGDEVKQGALLFKIDPREYISVVKRAEADMRRATTEFDRCKSEAERASKLMSSRALGIEDYEQRVAARDTAAATLMQTQAAVEGAKLQLSYTEIHSPIDGQISRAMVTRGNLVGQNETTLLTTIVSMDPLYVYFDTPERDLVDFQRARQAGIQADVLSRSLPVEVGITTEEGYPHAGKIDFRENRVDAGTGTVRLRGQIPNPHVNPGKVRLLYPGLYARVRVPTGAPRALLSIPEDALMTGQEGRYVYVVGEGDIIQKRTVQVGPQVSKVAVSTTGGRVGWTLNASGTMAAEAPKSIAVTAVVSIESGLQATDRVVVNGLMKSRPGSPVSPQLWELKPPPETISK